MQYTSVNYSVVISIELLNGPNFSSRLLVSGSTFSSSYSYTYTFDGPFSTTSILILSLLSSVFSLVLYEGTLNSNPEYFISASYKVSQTPINSLNNLSSFFYILLISFAESTST